MRSTLPARGRPVDGFRIGDGVRGVQSFVQGAERVGGRRGIDLAGVLVEEFESRHDVLFLRCLQGTGRDVPDALAAVDRVDRSPVKIHRHVPLIPGPLPRLVHLRTAEQPHPLRVHQVTDPLLVQHPFAAQMMTSRERPVLDAERSLGRGW